MPGHPLIGKTIGNYAIEGFLAKGGMGGVLLGRHTTLGTPVAIKVLDQKIDKNDPRYQLFRTEAERIAVCSRQNRHIVPILDYGITEGFPYLIMPLAAGDLTLLISPRQILPIHIILTYATQIASALTTIHENGLVSRDLKPQNILISPYKNPFDSDEIVLWLADLGISIVSPSIVSLTKHLHNSHQYIAGTYQFMPIEQWEGLAVRASDQYALGIMLYSWFTGVYPFELNTNDPLAWKAAHANHSIPPFSHVTDQWDVRYEPVISQMLAKKPADRFPNVLGAVQRLHKIYATIQQEEEEKKRNEEEKTFNLQINQLIEGHNQERAAKERQMNQLEKENRSLIHLFQEAQEQMATLTEEHNQGQIIREKRIHQLEENNVALTHSLQETQARTVAVIEEHKRRCVTKESEMSQLEKENISLTHLLQEAQAQTTTLTKENTDLKKQLQAVQKQIAMEKRSVRSLTSFLSHRSVIASLAGLTLVGGVLTWSILFFWHSPISIPTGIQARGFVTFTNEGSHHILIPTGTVVQAKNGILFATNADAIVPPLGDKIGNTMYVPIVAIKPGPSGNVAPNTVTVIPDQSLQVIASAQSDHILWTDLDLRVTNSDPMRDGSAIRTTLTNNVG